VKVLSKLWSKLNLGLLAILAFLAMTLTASAQDSDLTAMVTSASTLWDAVKVVVLGIVGFLILLTVVKLVKRR